MQSIRRNVLVFMVLVAAFTVLIASASASAPRAGGGLGTVPTHEPVKVYHHWTVDNNGTDAYGHGTHSTYPGT